MEEVSVTEKYTKMEEEGEGRPTACQTAVKKNVEMEEVREDKTCETSTEKNAQMEEAGECIGCETAVEKNAGMEEEGEHTTCETATEKNPDAEVEGEYTTSLTGVEEKTVGSEEHKVQKGSSFQADSDTDIVSLNQLCHTLTILFLSFGFNSRSDSYKGHTIMYRKFSIIHQCTFIYDH